MSTYSLRRQAAYIILLFITLLLLVPRAGHSGDVDYWYTWACYIFEHGLGNVYQLENNNYNPFYHYILWLFGKFMGSTSKIDHYRHWLKAMTLLFDFGGAFWAASLVRERERRFGLVLLLLFNIAYLYNTLIWEQVDAIYTCFAFGAVVLAVQRRLVRSALCFVLALATKTQAIIFLPPLLLLWGPQWWHQPKQLLRAGIASAALGTVVLAPFIWWSWESYLPRVIDINLHATEVWPRLSMSCYNLWYFVASDPAPNTVADSNPWAGLPYRTWGLLLFFAFSALALWPLLVAAVRSLRLGLSGAAPAGGTSAAPNMALTLLSCSIIPLLFAFFNTQMHERYWHAAILFLAAYGFVRRDYVPYVLASVAYFLNLESVLRFLDLNYGVLIFHPLFIASLFGITILLVLFKIYHVALLQPQDHGTKLARASVPAVSMVAERAG